MSEDSATRMLQSLLIHKDIVDSNPADAKAMVSWLTHLPLAIAQAAAYINENALTLADYMALLEGEEQEIIELLSEDFEDDARYSDVTNPVATTWLISFRQIQQRDPLAADYMSFLACIDHKDVPQVLLPPGPSRKKEMDAIGTLSREHPATLKSMAKLALGCHAQSRFQESIVLGLRAMEGQKKVLGEDHPETLSTMSHLAMTHSDLSQWKEAEAVRGSGGA